MLRKMRGHLPQGTLRVLLATDSQAAVRELQAGPERQKGKVEQDTWRLMREIFYEGSQRELSIQWVLSHCSLPHNDEAERAGY